MGRTLACAYKCFAGGKTLPQAEFISAEEVKTSDRRSEYRTLKTEQSNQKYEEQATEGNKHLIVELFVKRVKQDNFVNSNACIIRYTR